jgi:hypothetical protein
MVITGKFTAYKERMMGWGGWKEKERNLRFREYENDMV